MAAAEEPALARFRRGETIGRGGSAEIFRGVDLSTGAPVAIKRLHAHLDDPVSIERFEREARLLTRISDPHVVRCIAHGVDAEGRRCIVLEWVDGEDLAKRQKLRPLRRAQALSAIRQAALALASLHDAGIVHRDVKPANFLVTDLPDGEVAIKLIDLGVARASVETTVTALGLAIGTPSYMSPEQARGEARVDARADVFSLGVMLYELVSGRKPYSGDDIFAVLARIVLQDPPRLAEVLPGIDRALDAVVSRAMAKDPAARFGSARELCDAVARIHGPDDSAPLVDPSGVAPTASGLYAALEQRVITAVFAASTDDGALERFESAAARADAPTRRMLGRRAVAVFGSTGSQGDEAQRAARLALEVADGALAIAVVTATVAHGAGGPSGNAIDRGTQLVERSRGEIRIDAPTARLLASHFVVGETRGDRVLYRERVALGAGPLLLGRPTPMVGRDRELGTLAALWEQCVGEPIARAAIVVGNPGAGKSRLRFELLRRIGAADSDDARGDERRPKLLFGRGDSLSAGSPFGMLGQAVRRLAGILDGEPAEQARRKLAAMLAASLEQDAVTRTTPFVAELASVPLSDEDASEALLAARRSPELMGDAMRSAWQEWILAETARHPVVVVFEDLHWGDLPSVLFADAALRVAHDRPLFVLAFARPEVAREFPELWSQREPELVRLGGLTPKACTALVRHVLGDGADEATVRRVVERADGNAFFLEELIRAVAEGTSEQLPDTVLGMVQARLDALGGPSKRLLRVASVFGGAFWRGGVCALLGGAADGSATTSLAAAEVDDTLARLTAREVLTARATASLPGEQEYVFRHALLRDAAYAMVLDEDRRTAHRLAGEWLEHKGCLDAIALAEHFARGGVRERALPWYRRAAEQALEGNDLRAAIERAEAGIAAGAEGETLGLLRSVQAEAHRWRGELAIAERRGVSAVEQLPKGGAAWLRAVGDLAATAGLHGHLERVQSLASLVLETPCEPGLESATVVCLVRVVVPIFWAGLEDEAQEAFARIDALAAEPAQLAPLARGAAHFSRATRALYAGAPATHLVEQIASMEAYAQAGDERSVCTRRVAVGFALCELGRYEEAAAALREALASAERMGLHNIVARARSNLGHVLGRLRRLDDARSEASLAVQAYVEQGDPRMEAASRAYLAGVLLAIGDAQGAEREAAMAAVLASSAPVVRALSLALSARALLRLDRTTDALRAAEEAHTLLEAQRHVDEGESLVRLAYVEALTAAGRLDDARAAATRARERVRARAGRIERAEWRASFEAIEENAALLAGAGAAPPEK